MDSCVIEHKTICPKNERTEKICYFKVRKKQGAAQAGTKA